MNEDVLNTLLAEGVDLPTAMAAAQDDSGPQQPRKGNRWAFSTGLAIGVLFATVAWLLK